MKTILVPIDFSKSSLNALEEAATLAGKTNSEIQILHIIDIVPEAEGILSVETAKNLCAALAEEVQARSGCKIEINISEGLIGHVIANTVYEKKSDLVVMGAHGISGPRELFVGHNSYYVIKKAPCPVLLIPEDHKIGAFEKILLPVQQSVFSAKVFEVVHRSVLSNLPKCLVKIIAVAKAAKATLEYSTRLNEMRDKYQGSNIEFNTRYYSDRNIAEAVFQKMEQIKADLIVISPGLDIPDKPFFVGPFAQRIINHSKVPVLSILRSGNNL